MKVAVIGAGISGATCAKLLKTRGYHVTVFESGDQVGGLVKCTREGGNLFHRVGGHVFNAKNQSVSNWFWSHFDKETEFLFSRRNAAILMRDRFVNYPLENHLWQLDDATATRIVSELLDALKHGPQSGHPPNHSCCGCPSCGAKNFRDFLLDTFGQTLCDMYFLPYNTKIWRLDLASMPIGWLDGKLPMPKLNEIIQANVLRKEEADMVHSRFYYPKEGGSQFIINRLTENIEVSINTPVNEIDINDGIHIKGNRFDAAIYTGDVRKLGGILKDEDRRLDCLTQLRSNGTTTVLCSADANPYSWVYIPDADISCHRIIMTGNFAPSNNAEELGAGRISCTVEFVGAVEIEEINAMISKLPFNVRMIDMNFEPNSYIIHSETSRSQVNDAKHYLAAQNLWLCGRFAEWEYYNMDAAIAAAMQAVDTLEAAIGSAT